MQDFIRTFSDSYKHIIIGGLVLGVFVWYFRFLKESEEGFTVKTNNNRVDKMRGILKRVENDSIEKKRKHVSFLSARSLASDVADKWSPYAFIEGAKELASEIYKTVAAPWVHRIERMFS